MPKPLTSEIDRLLGSRLRKLRQQCGVSAAALAEAVGTSQQQISRYENGENKLAAGQLFRIARSLGVPVSWFFQGAEALEPEHRVGDSRAHYQVARDEAQVREDLALLEAMWPRLAEAQRAALLQLLDSFL